MTKLFLLLCSISVLIARTDILDEVAVRDFRGNTFYVLTLCKDGIQYSAIHKGDYMDMNLNKDFQMDYEKNMLEVVRCQLDIKSDKELEKINGGIR